MVTGLSPVVQCWPGGGTTGLHDQGPGSLSPPVVVCFRLFDVDGSRIVESSAEPLTTAVQIRRDVISAEPEHPALARLRQEILLEVPVEQGITRYDRMHHRHNRSHSRGR